MTNTAKEIVDIQSKLHSERSTLESHWREIAEVLLPRQDDFFEETKTEGEKRTQKIIDSMPQQALNKFAASMESILTPRASRWHRVKTGNDELDKNQEVAEYMDVVTDTLFKKRYASTANYSSQQHETYMSLGAFGTGVLGTEEDIPNQGIRYRSSHIAEHHFMVNAAGLIDVDYRKYRLTALQAAQKFGEDRLPGIIQRALKKEPHKRFDFIHCVRPNEDRIMRADNYKSYKFSSFHVAVDECKFLGEGGFRTFPYHASRYVTAPNETYGRSVGMIALSEIKMLNSIRKTDLRARHLAVSPPILTANERGLRRPLMKPDAVNHGALDENGNPLMKPYMSGARIEASNDTLEKSHEIINDIFLVTLFQILVDSPQMTATEVLQRAQEKGALLSPTAGRQQSEALGPMIEREIDILEFNGWLPPMPDVLREAGGEYEIEYTAPLNVMQKSGEAASATQIINDALPLIQLDPSLANRIDFGEYLEIMREARGAPAKLFRSQEEVEQMTAEQQQEQAMAQMVEAAPQVAGSVKDLAQAEALAGG